METQDETREDIEEALAAIKQEPEFQLVLTEYNRLLAILGNVKDDDIVALVCLAADHT